MSYDAAVEDLSTQLAEDVATDGMDDCVGGEMHDTHGPIYAEPYSEEVAQRYRFMRKIGEGAFGEVHEAVDTHTGEKVAVKRIGITGGRDGPTLSKAVLREVSERERVVSGQRNRVV